MERAGMNADLDLDAADLPPFQHNQVSEQELPEPLSESLLLCFGDRELRGLVGGLVPLFTCSCDLLPLTHSPATMRCRSGLALACVGEGLVSLLLPFGLLRSFVWMERSASMQLAVRSGLAKIADLVATCGRRWRDATRPILLKLSLLRDLLTSYQLAMEPCQFLATVSLCGLWHPVALTSFSQHWNEQGLTRLRSGIETASQSILANLQLRALPWAANLVLASRCLYS